MDSEKNKAPPTLASFLTLTTALKSAVFDKGSSYENICGSKPILEEKIHILCGELNPFDHIAQIFYGLSNQGLAMGRKVVEGIKEGFDVRGSCLINNTTVEPVEVKLIKFY